MQSASASIRVSALTSRRHHRHRYRWTTVAARTYEYYPLSIDDKNPHRSQNGYYFFFTFYLSMYAIEWIAIGLLDARLHAEQATNGEQSTKHK